MDVYLVVVQDKVVQSREYVVFAKDEHDAKERIKRGEFLSESEATTIDHDGESVVISSIKVGNNAGA
ncbi:hypothetical protein SEA_LABELLE_87 [Mycobacterium phage Labelle]|nr:hypothetical protein SEA_LABELLE_87 [Mycobacterium phage Labelle]